MDMKRDYYEDVQLFSSGVVVFWFVFLMAALALFPLVVWGIAVAVRRGMDRGDLALGLTGLTVTKLDGSAKGGILLAIADRIGVPVRFIGIGEAAEDMQPFSAEEFADALVSSGAQDETAA